MEAFKAIKIANNVHWVGAIDWNVRDFHGYLTPRGTTYNAFLITGAKNILIDTVKSSFYEEMLSRIRSVIQDARIDILISNHAEWDHSGSVPMVIDQLKPAKLLASPSGTIALKRLLGKDYGFESVKWGDKLHFPGIDLHFMDTRMLHWPDSMFTYFAQEELLFSQDAFGLHTASINIFAHELPQDIVDFETKKYYANILWHLGPMVENQIKNLMESGLKIRTIAPAHGPVWAQNPMQIVDAYQVWAKGNTAREVLICFDSMWGCTAQMAQAIGEGAASTGALTRVLSLKSNHRSDIVTYLMNAGALAVGSPNLNNTIFPTIGDLLTYIQGLRPANKYGAAFGSYGWNNDAVPIIADLLTKLKFKIIADPLGVQYMPDKSDLVLCRELGIKMGNAALSTKPSI